MCNGVFISVLASSQVNTESHLQPVLCSAMCEAEAEASEAATGGDEAAKESKEEEPSPARHHKALLQLLAKERSCIFTRDSKAIGELQGIGNYIWNSTYSWIVN